MNIRLALIIFSLGWILIPGGVFADTPDLISKGDKALAQGSFALAEQIFTEAVAANPEGYRALKSLSEIKFQLGKYEEANELINRLLALKVTGGRQVQVFVKGQAEPIPGELIDETVVKMGIVKSESNKFLKSPEMLPIEHYRIFLPNEGKVKLLPKSQVKVRYLGIPRVIRERVVELQDKVKKKIISNTPAEESVEMVTLEDGCFIMGNDQGGPLERPAHEVCVSSFRMDKYEVTQKDFQSKMNGNPSLFPEANLPVDSATWMEGREYCRKINKRLPTEAEWEYSARAGTTTQFYWGDQMQSGKANFCDRECVLNVRFPEISDGFKNTAPVGSFPPNPFGLHDMAGNVSEWTFDSYKEGYYIISPKNNPRGSLLQVSKNPKEGD